MSASPVPTYTSRARRRDRDRADRCDRLRVENRGPRASGIRRLPDAAADGSEVENGRLSRHAGDRVDAPAAERPDVAPLETGVESGWGRLPRGNDREVVDRDGQEDRGCEQEDSSCVRHARKHSRTGMAVGMCRSIAPRSACTQQAPRRRGCSFRAAGIHLDDSRAAHPGPRSTFPGSAPVARPSAITGMPFTSTHCMPSESWFGFGERRAVPHLSRVEHHDVRPHPHLEHAAVAEAHALRRQRGELPDRVLQRQPPLLAHVLPQDARKRPVGARVRVLLAEQAVGRGALRVVVDRHPRLLRARARRPAPTSRTPRTDV